jgi:hypothetical protein
MRRGSQCAYGMSFDGDAEHGRAAVAARGIVSVTEPSSIIITARDAKAAGAATGGLAP